MSTKTSGLAAAGAIASTDLLMMVDVSDTSMAASGTNVKPTVAELATAITTVGSLATDTEVASAVSTHAGATDPHGDRAYADALVDDLSGVSDASTARTNLGVDYTTTDERARDAVGTALTAGAGVTITVNDGANTITVAAVPSDPLATVASSSTAQTITVSSTAVLDLTLTNNCTLTMSGATAGVAWSVTIVLRQDGVGSRTVSWPSGTKWAGGAAPTLSTGAAAIDVVTLITVDGGTVWFGFLGGKAFA